VTLDEYQQKASTTDAPEIARNPDLSVLLPGLAGEVGSLLTLYKKRLRDGDAFQMAQSRLSGDSLWYLAAIARRRELSLESVAVTNLEKRDRADFRARIKLCSMSKCHQRSNSHPVHCNLAGFDRQRG